MGMRFSVINSWTKTTGSCPNLRSNDSEKCHRACFLWDDYIHPHDPRPQTETARMLSRGVWRAGTGATYWRYTMISFKKGRREKSCCIWLLIVKCVVTSIKSKMSGNTGELTKSLFIRSWPCRRHKYKSWATSPAACCWCVPLEVSQRSQAKYTISKGEIKFVKLHLRSLLFKDAVAFLNRSYKNVTPLL